MPLLLRIEPCLCLLLGLPLRATRRVRCFPRCSHANPSHLRRVPLLLGVPELLKVCLNTRNGIRICQSLAANRARGHDDSPSATRAYAISWTRALAGIPPSESAPLGKLPRELD